MTEEAEADFVRRGLGASISAIENYIEMIKSSLHTSDIIKTLEAMAIEADE